VKIIADEKWGGYNAVKLYIHLEVLMARLNQRPVSGDVGNAQLWGLDLYYAAVWQTAAGG
jgi:hypothetical protein